MAPVPPLTPSTPEPTGTRVPLRTRITISDEVFQQSGAELILSKLREMIAEQSEDTDTILGTIAVAAHSLSGASGAAIAMPRGGAVVCVGRSGETAPELGDRLNVNSGISGECLRTGISLRCDDARRDIHVDAEVCRQMGLRSIAVVPLRGRHDRVGVLEAFSTQAYAFTQDKMELLERLAGLAEAAWAQRLEVANRSESETPAAGIPGIAVLGSQVSELEVPQEVPRIEALERESRLSGASRALERVEAAIAKGLHQERQAKRKLHHVTLAAISLVIVCLVSVVAWTVWGKSGRGTVVLRQSSTKPQVATAESPEVASGVGLVWRPGVEHPTSSKPAPSRLAKSTADVQIPDAVVRRQPSPAQGHDNNASSGASADSTEKSEAAPEIASSGAPTDLGHVPSKSVTL